MSRTQKQTQEECNKNTTDITDNIQNNIQCDSTQLLNSFEKTTPTSHKEINRISKTCHSDGNIIRTQNDHGVKPKVVNKVRSWNSKDGKGMQNDTDVSTVNKVEAALVADLGNMNLDPDVSDDNLCKSDWLRARDSLENLLLPKTEKTTVGDVSNSKSAHCSHSTDEDSLVTTSPQSEPSICANKASGSSNLSVAKVLTWDPWDKLGRKNKKENKRRKLEKSPLHSRDNNKQPSANICSKDHTAGDEVRPKADNTMDENEQEEESYVYQPYHPENTKSVEFTNEVMVVYFTGEEVVRESVEPLKKELEQQIRNKEMRRGHMPTTLTGKRRYSDDFMNPWFKN